MTSTEQYHLSYTDISPGNFYNRHSIYSKQVLSSYLPPMSTSMSISALAHSMSNVHNARDNAERNENDFKLHQKVKMSGGVKSPGQEKG